MNAARTAGAAAAIVAGLLCAGGSRNLAMAGFPTTPYYPYYRYPSVLDAPRGYGPTPVYGFAGPSYRWGWFGVQYRPRMVHHTGVSGDYWQTGYRWGY
jgi:hypothetical protein